MTQPRLIPIPTTSPVNVLSNRETGELAIDCTQMGTGATFRIMFDINATKELFERMKILIETHGTVEKLLEGSPEKNQ